MMATSLRRILSCLSFWSRNCCGMKNIVCSGSRCVFAFNFRSNSCRNFCIVVHFKLFDSCSPPQWWHFMGHIVWSLPLFLLSPHLLHSSVGDGQFFFMWPGVLHLLHRGILGKGRNSSTSYRCPSITNFPLFSVRVCIPPSITGQRVWSTNHSLVMCNIKLRLKKPHDKSLQGFKADVNRLRNTPQRWTWPSEMPQKKHWISEKTMKVTDEKRKLRLVKHVSRGQAELHKDMSRKVWGSPVDVVCFSYLRGVRRRKENKKKGGRVILICTGARWLKWKGPTVFCTTLYPNRSSEDRYVYSSLKKIRETSVSDVSN